MCMNALLACVSMHSVRTSSAHGGQPRAYVPLEPAKEGCERPCGCWDSAHNCWAISPAPEGGL